MTLTLSLSSDAMFSTITVLLICWKTAACRLSNEPLMNRSNPPECQSERFSGKDTTQRNLMFRIKQLIKVV